jgi:serine/threonine-protein kinase RsbW
MIRRFPAHPSSLGEIRRFVRTTAESTLGEARTEELALAVSEACANAIRHTDTNEIQLGWRLDGDCVEIEVSDRGVFRNRFPVPELEPGGRGILLMTAFVDEIAIQEGTPGRPGTLVRL